MRNINKIIIFALIAFLFLIISNLILTQGSLWKLKRMSTGEVQRKAVMMTASADSAFIMSQTLPSVFIDIRTRDEYMENHIPGALSIPYRQFVSQPFQLNTKDREDVYIIYGQDEELQQSRIIANLLIRSNFKYVYVLRGGFISWATRRYPVE
jgi:rhodanese-related sulfurtransferase